MSINLVAFCAGIAVFLTLWGVLSRKVPSINGTNLLVALMPSMATRLGPSMKRTQIEKLILEAGTPDGVTPETVNSRRFTFAIAGVMLGLALAVFGIFPQFFITVPLLGIVGWLVPVYLLRRSRSARLEACMAQLPEALDLLRITMSSGDNIVPALREVAARTPPGVVQEELEKTVADLSAGKTLQESLERLSLRLPSPDMESFTRAVIQSERLGSDVAATLASQATATRSAREARIDKKIAGLSTLIFLPVMAGNVPAVLLLLMAPPMAALLSFLS